MFEYVYEDDLGRDQILIVHRETCPEHECKGGTV